MSCVVSSRPQTSPCMSTPSRRSTSSRASTAFGGSCSLTGATCARWTCSADLPGPPLVRRREVRLWGSHGGAGPLDRVTAIRTWALFLFGVLRCRARPRVIHVTCASKGLQHEQQQAPCAGMWKWIWMGTWWVDRPHAHVAQALCVWLCIIRCNCGCVGACNVCILASAESAVPGQRAGARELLVCKSDRVRVYTVVSIRTPAMSEKRNEREHLSRQAGSFASWSTAEGAAAILSAHRARVPYARPPSPVRGDQFKLYPTNRARASHGTHGPRLFVE